MDDLRQLLATKSFWFYYQAREQVDAEFVQKVGRVSKKRKGLHSVTFRLDVIPPLSIKIDVLLDFYSIELYLADRRAKKRHQLGWWDEARWHPFSLRWDEVEKLVKYWKDHPDYCSIGTDSALLLLARFVGNGVDEREEWVARKERIAAAYRELGDFLPGEVDELTERTLLKPTESDYRWSMDPNLGWVFGGNYPCYSIRNKEHSGGSEGKFPFAEWNRLMAAI